MSREETRLNPSNVGIAVDCVVCGMRKKPWGRSAPLGMANSLCDRDCPGYDQEPHAGSLWPGESEADFGRILLHRRRGDHPGRPEGRERRPGGAMTALLLLSALTLGYFLGILQMLLAAWPVAGAIAFVLIRLQSGRTPLFWLDVALETLIDMAADAAPTFLARFGQRARERRIAA